MEEGGALQSDIQDPMQKLSRVTTQVSVHAVSEMKPIDWRFEQWSDNAKRKTFFQAFVRTSVPMDSFEVQEDAVVSELSENEAGE
jgi:hypothetical protein